MDWLNYLPVRTVPQKVASQTPFWTWNWNKPAVYSPQPVNVPGMQEAIAAKAPSAMYDYTIPSQSYKWSNPTMPREFTEGVVKVNDIRNNHSNTPTAETGKTPVPGKNAPAVAAQPAKKLLPYNNNGMAVDQVKALQLKLFGQNSTEIDGKWGAKSQAAFDAYRAGNQAVDNEEASNKVIPKSVNRLDSAVPNYTALATKKEKSSPQLAKKKKGGEINFDLSNILNKWKK